MPKKSNKPSYKKLLKLVSSASWVAQIKSLPQDHQGIIARIIWWDFFSIDEVSSRISDFDEWLDFDSREIDPPLESLAKSLSKMGYPISVAMDRFKPRHKKNYYEPLKSNN